MRRCNKCGESIQCGYVVNDGDEYYCDDCITEVFTVEEFDEMYVDDSIYWTVWEEEDE